MKRLVIEIDLFDGGRYSKPDIAAMLHSWIEDALANDPSIPLVTTRIRDADGNTVGAAWVDHDA